MATLLLFALLLSETAYYCRGDLLRSLLPLDTGCAVYEKIHTGCEVAANQTLPCANINLVTNTTTRSSPPWGKRFQYDTGDRTISKIGPTNVNGCALQCVRDGPSCKGFTLLTKTGMCYTVNDTIHTVDTKEATSNYNLSREGPSCEIDCHGGDGKALAPWGQPRPVAAGGGLTQCQQYCDIAETSAPGSCAAVIYQTGANGGLCSLVNASAPTVKVLFPQLTFRRRSFAVVAADGRRATSQSTVIKQWLVGPSDRVFEAARPWQTAFCRQQLTKIDWAAASGTFVSVQLALLLLATDNADQQTTTAQVSASDLIATADDETSSRISASQVELSQVGFVSATSCSPAVCGARAYSAELGAGTHWYPDLLQPLGSSGYPNKIVLQTNRTRTIFIGLRVPPEAPPGNYKGNISVTYEDGGCKSIDVALRVWPISHQCLARQTKGYGAAYGFDHNSVSLLYPSQPSMHATMREFTNQHHVSSNSLDLWQLGNNVTSAMVGDLLQAQSAFLADALYLTPQYDASYMEAPVNRSWVSAKVASMQSRMQTITAWGFQNQSIVYGPDELPASSSPGINILFGEVKRRWPGTRTLAVINWPAQDVIEAVDIQVFQYQELENTAMAASRDAYVQKGKQDIFLNSFIDVPLLKQRLIPWLAAQSNLTGWLYWYVNFGWGKSSPSFKQQILPLQPVDQDTGYSNFNVTVPNGEFWTNGDGNWMYPGAYGPLSSLRLEAYRMGLEDRALLALLEAEDRMELSERLVRGATNWTLDGKVLEQTRRDAAARIGTMQC